MATITHPRAGLERTRITEPAGERAGGCGELGAASAPGEGQGHLPERGGLRRPPAAASPGPRPAVGVWNAETNLPRQLPTAAYSAAASTRQPRSFPRGAARREANRRAPEEGSSPTVPLEGRGGGEGKKELLTHQTRGLRSLNGLQRKLKGNKDGSPVSADPRAGHLFADRARAGSVPTAAPAWRPPASFTTSPSKGGLPPPGRTPRPLPARQLSRSQRQHSLMIKHRRWASPAGFANTAQWLCLIITTTRT